MFTAHFRPLSEAPPELRAQLLLLLNQACSPTTVLFQLDLFRQEIIYWCGRKFVCSSCEAFLESLAPKLRRLRLPKTISAAIPSFFLTLDCQLKAPAPLQILRYALRLGPLCQDERGDFSVFLGFFAPSTYLKGSRIRLHQFGAKVYWTTTDLGEPWEAQPLPQITEEELWLLTLIAQGLSEEDIADCLTCTKATIKKRKARICERLCVKNCQLALLRIHREYLGYIWDTEEGITSDLS